MCISRCCVAVLQQLLVNFANYIGLPKAPRDKTSNTKDVHRPIGITKNSLRRAAGRRKISDSELRTLSSEEGRTINACHLTYVSSNSMDILRPIDFLLPKASLILEVPLLWRRNCFVGSSGRFSPQQ
ncbi:unnamed protein product [Gongylonema pulchrum]|uniref:Uncharacterized protein n=1 Tax=Gongylonema pulchrum TaxID=637853 RepID=A0A183D566_9BILA|nr:unnamed protein product [Gongylonema pulchrum]